MRLVVLGSQGFIFSHVVEHFLAKGWEVHGFDNLSAGSHPELIPVWEKAFAGQDLGSGPVGRFVFHKEDVSFAPVIDKIVRLRPDYLIMAAHISDVDYSLKNTLKTMQANNRATENAFEAARLCPGLRKFVYVSTDEVYGECDHQKNEAEILFPRNIYSLTKAYGSLARIAYDVSFPALRDRTAETRFCNVFGPRQDDRKIIPAIKRALAGGRPLELHNKGMGIRQWIHVSDIPPAIELILEKGNRTYNITTGIAASVLDLIDLAERATGKRVPTVPGKRTGMDMRYLMDSTRIRDDLGWAHSVDPEKALVDYFRA